MTSRSETSALGRWAQTYAALGWPVFPLVPRDKVPLTRTGFKAATIDPDIIEAWWRSSPNANIGAATGHAFDVLDVDGDKGLATLRKIWDELGIVYRHPGPLSLTGKGWHMLFAVTGSGNGANLAGPDSKIDFRGNGGYVVVPPSIHPLGHSYQWDPERGFDLPLPEATDWLTALLSRDDNPAREEKAPKPVIFQNADYEALVAGGFIPKDQLPRAFQERHKRFERPDILSICAAKGIVLRRRSHYFVGSCPYHEDSTPSMAVYPANNTFHCYGCNAHGDSFDLQNGTHL